MTVIRWLFLPKKLMVYVFFMFLVSRFSGTVVMLVLACSLHVLRLLRGGEERNGVGKLGSQEKQHFEPLRGKKKHLSLYWLQCFVGILIPLIEAAPFQKGMPPQGQRQKNTNADHLKYKWMGLRCRNEQYKSKQVRACPLNLGKPCCITLTFYTRKRCGVKYTSIYVWRVSAWRDVPYLLHSSEGRQEHRLQLWIPVVQFHHIHALIQSAEVLRRARVPCRVNVGLLF